MVTLRKRFSHSETYKVISAELTAPFLAEEIKWKPQCVKGNRALALAYLDARAVQDRLDDVVGAMNWQDQYEILADGSVVCTLRIRFSDEWISKSDVGSPSDQPDSGDRIKAAFSDALKRAAVKFGVGRYLYQCKPQWVEYDPASKRIVGKPQLVINSPRFTHERQGEKEEINNHPNQTPRTTIPQSGEELYSRLTQYEMKLVRAGRCQPGTLIDFVTQQGLERGYGNSILSWPPGALSEAAGLVRHFESLSGSGK